jgi:hypothetical protein
MDYYDIVKDAIAQLENAQLSKVTTDNLKPAEILERARVRPTDTVKEDPVAIWVKSDASTIQFGTLGNFSMITGKAKSKKSFTLCMLVAAAIEGSQYEDGPFTIRLPSGKHRILYFDTEQGKYRVWKSISRVCRMAGIHDSTYLEYYDLRGYEPKQRVDAINSALNENNPQKDIGLVIVDGCRDLIHDINDPKDATKLATLILQWTANNDLHLITVLHQNKGDNNARGHVGTEMINKAETVISVEVDKQDKRVSIVNPTECRDMDFPGFAFTINPDGLPELLSDYELNAKGTTAKKMFDPNQYPPESHHKILKEIFRLGDISSRDEYIQQTKNGWSSMGLTIGDSAAKQAIAYWRQMGWADNITKQGQKAVYQYKYKVGGSGG